MNRRTAERSEKLMRLSTPMIAWCQMKLIAGQQQELPLPIRCWIGSGFVAVRNEMAWDSARFTATLLPF
ncbi:hypothetical protein, partial [Ochrobactrum sp. Q0168]|uniref:hypothetical protein n=1 Tax=Ochrobactrum sp. Q0168 TaxID=2793241 RepID=UPI001AED260A